MPTKVNSAGQQQPYDASTGEFAKMSKAKDNTEDRYNDTMTALSKGYTRSEVADMDDKELKIANLKEELKSAKGIFARAKIKNQIEMLEGGYASIEEMQKAKAENRDKLAKEKEKAKETKQVGKEPIKEEKPIVDEEHKRKQLEVIKANNQAFTDNAVWIRDIGDIKTFEETFDDEESFVYPDYSRQDAERDLKRGKIKVYSSKDLKNGNFVTPSRMQANEYAGGGEVHSAIMNIEDIAWINGDEGQIAKV